MKNITLLVLCLMIKLISQGQSPNTADRSTSVETVKLSRKSDGLLYQVDKAGAAVKIRVDSSQVTGFRQLVATVNKRTAFQNLASLRASRLTLESAPEVINLTDKNLSGTFILDRTDKNTPDNTGRVLVTSSGLRYKRVIHGGLLQLDWYLAKGDKTTDDTQAVQNAINDAISAANALDGELPSYGKSGTLLVPVGSYKIKTLTVAGSIRLIGQGGGTYAGSTFIQAQPGISMIILAPDKNGSSNSTVFENICFKSGSPTVNPGVAQIKTLPGIQSNSIYIRNCWFKTPENYGIWLTQGDDIQIVGCTFDVCPFHAIRLGTQGGGMVTNSSISNNTFYQVSVTHIKLDNVTGAVISNNRAYNSDNTQISTATFIDGTSATNINGLSIIGNEYNSLPNFVKIPTNAIGLVISGNTGYQTSGYFLNLTGGGVLHNASITGNSLFAKGAWSNAPITGTGCGLQGSVILGNSFLAGVLTPLAINLPDSRTINNIIDKNAFTNFQTKDNLINRYANGQIIPDGISSGDLLYYDGVKISRIKKGSDGQILKMVSGLPTWSN